MTKNTAENGGVDQVHKFEKAGLGKAPYSFTGGQTMTFQACSGAPIQPGGSCDYCGTAIMQAFWFRSADGKSFKVGSSCVNKSGDAGMIRIVKTEERQRQRKVRHARESQQIAYLKDNIEKVRGALQALPHPAEWAAKKGLTKWDWATWMLVNSGNAGKIRLLKEIKPLI